MNKPDGDPSRNFGVGSAREDGVALAIQFFETTSSSRTDQRRGNSNEQVGAGRAGMNQHAELVLFITPRDRRALQLLASETGNGEIAEYLGMSASEVESYLTMLFAKVGAASQSEAVAIAAR